MNGRPSTDTAGADRARPSLLEQVENEKRAENDAARSRRATAGSLRARTVKLLNTPARRRAAWTAAAVAAVAIAVTAWFVLRPVPKPDFERDRLDKVFSYTLLTDEFNRLPVEERLELIGTLVQRLRSMSGEDSMLLAAFAARIEGAAREQLTENASRLAIDLWDKYAVEYENVPPESREIYLDQAFVEFTRLMESVGGAPRDIPDEQRLAEGRRQAQRDLERVRDPRYSPGTRQLSRTFQFMDQGVGGHATPQQRARAQLLMRDMARRLRGQDVSTGRSGGG